MTQNEPSQAEVDGDDVQSVLRRVREVDPDCSFEAVERYIREIAEMAIALENVEIEDIPAGQLYSPWWNGRDER